jgi:hypothetical protein
VISFSVHRDSLFAGHSSSKRYPAGCRIELEFELGRERPGGLWCIHGRYLSLIVIIFPEFNFRTEVNIRTWFESNIILVE